MKQSIPSLHKITENQKGITMSIGVEMLITLITCVVAAGVLIGTFMLTHKITKFFVDLSEKRKKK